MSAETDDETRIRAKAHELWEAAGRPEGLAERHWEEAKEIVALRDSFASTLTPVEETVEEPAEPALAFQNLGDVPEMTDLGDAPHGPSWSAAAEAGGAAGEAEADRMPSVEQEVRKARRTGARPAR